MDRGGGFVALVLEGWYWYSAKQEQVNSASLSTTVDDPVLGSCLVASNGMTLYRYTKDSEGASGCFETCAVNWSPYMVSVVTPFVMGVGMYGKLGMMNRMGGGSQLTYNGSHFILEE